MIYSVDSGIHPLKNENQDNSIPKPYFKQEKTQETGPGLFKHLGFGWCPLAIRPKMGREVGIWFLYSSLNFQLLPFLQSLLLRKSTCTNTLDEALT